MMRDHSTLTERWLQDRINDDPSLLDLGDLRVLAREKPLRGGRRLDLLLVDENTATRFEVEIQLGPTDESQIVRALESWDLERRRYPSCNHVAVIVAEEITSRFFRVIGLFGESVPVVAVQVSALDLGEDMVTLVFTRVLDQRSVAAPDGDSLGAVSWDRNYWRDRASLATVALVDEMVALIIEMDPSVSPNFHKLYIGLRTGSRVTNYVSFRPRTEYVLTDIKIPESADLEATLDATDIIRQPYDHRVGRYSLQVWPDMSGRSRVVLVEMFMAARSWYAVQPRGVLQT